MGRGLLAGRRAARTAFAFLAGILILATVGSAPALTATHRSNVGPTLTIGITGPGAVRPGDDIVFTVLPYATVPVNATNVVLTVPVPAGTTFQSAVQEAPSGQQPTFTCTKPAVGGTGTITCTTASMLNGVGATFDIDFHVPVATADGTTIHTTASVSADGATLVDAAPLNTYIGGADVHVDVSGRTQAPAGGSITYTVLAENYGTESASNFTLIAGVPSGTTLVSATQTGGTPLACTTPTVDGGVQLTCTAASFASGATAQFDVVLLVGHTDVHPPSSQITLSARVAADTPDPVDTNNNAYQRTSLYDAGAPSAHTDLASDITATGATIGCSVEDDDIPTTLVVDYGTTPAYGSETAAVDVDSSHPTVALTGLTPSTPYDYRCVATNFAGVSTGLDASFTTLAGAPTVAPSVTTGDTSGVSTTHATLHGTVNPNGAATTYEFQYGTTTAYGASTGATSAGAGSDAFAVSADLVALSPATTYHYRLVASSVAGTTDGADQTFTTPASVPVAPTVQTWAASDVGDTAATIAGSFNPNGFSTAYWFEYGTTTAYGSMYPLLDRPVSGWDTVTLRLYGLHPGTTYHYRLVASNAGGTVNGGDVVFATTPGSALETPIVAGSSGSLTMIPALGAAGTSPPTMSWGGGAFPSGAVVKAETFCSTSDSTPPVLNGFAVGSLGVELTVTTNGSDVHAFSAPVEIVFPNAPPGLVPSYSNDDGATWTPIPLLSGTTLPDGQPDGYYRDGAGAVHILTRHATYFGLIGGLVLRVGNRPTFPVGSKRIFVYLAPERPAHAIVTLATRHGQALRTLKLTLPATTTRLKIPLPHGLRAGLYLVQVAATSGPASMKTTLLVRLVGTQHR